MVIKVEILKRRKDFRKRLRRGKNWMLKKMFHPEAFFLSFTGDLRNLDLRHSQAFAT